MNDAYFTVTGNLVDNPTLRTTKNGHLVANFRVASTARRFDQDKREWVDAATLFVSVAAWRGMGENVAASLRRGDPVVVYGRYTMREYLAKDETRRSAYELEAVAIGHDLNRGTSHFTKTARPTVAPIEVDEQGRPVDASHYREFLDEPPLDDDEAVEVDLQTGEVLEPVGAR